MRKERKRQMYRKGVWRERDNEKREKKTDV